MKFLMDNSPQWVDLYLHHHLHKPGRTQEAFNFSAAGSEDVQAETIATCLFTQRPDVCNSPYEISLIPHKVLVQIYPRRQFAPDQDLRTYSLTDRWFIFVAWAAARR
jgi:hypothetical protein